MPTDRNDIYMDAYLKGLKFKTGVDASWANKKYHEHRSDRTLSWHFS